MQLRRSSKAVIGLLAGLAGLILVAPPAQAGGDTGRYHGCAAHWRETATWNECQNATGVDVRLESDCNNQGDYTGSYKYVKGTVNPLDRFECRWKANGAALGFK
ncbi:hypothetical protein [Micromonospora sp. LHW51205]|uniref:hypothetical protein n=1 Tax=Micromonospora sp. LHW51205 TaxID=2248752 RepID=UPI0011BDA4F0|nr:hypothetical protein [Micromonospora sp. LHW51205]